MNKEFEKQYRDYITEQVPDMWSRIEAGLKEKSAVKTVMAEMTTEEIGTETSAERQHTIQTGREGRYVWWKNKTVAVLVTAVAAVFLCLLVPSALLGNYSKSDGGTMNASPSAFENKEMNGMADDMEAAGSVNSDAGMADREGMSDYGMAENAGKAEEDAMEYTDMENTASMETAITEVPVTTERFCVRVRIEESMEAVDFEYDAIYLAEVLDVVESEEDQAADSISEGTKICFYIGADTDKTEGETPKIGEEYEVMLEVVPEDENYFAKKINFIP